MYVLYQTVLHNMSQKSVAEDCGQFDQIIPYRNSYIEFGPCRFRGNNVQNGIFSIINTAGPQLRVQYDATHYAWINSLASGDATLGTTGTNLNIDSSNIFHVLNTTNSTSQTTGAAVIAGGLGVGGDIYCQNLVTDGTVTQNYIKRCSLLQAGGNVVNTDSTTFPQFTFPHIVGNPGLTADYMLPDSWIVGTPVVPYIFYRGLGALATPYATVLLAQTTFTDATHSSAAATDTTTSTDFTQDVCLTHSFASVATTGMATPCAVRLTIERRSSEAADTYTAALLVYDIGLFVHCSY